MYRFPIVLFATAAMVGSTAASAAADTPIRAIVNIDLMPIHQEAGTDLLRAFTRSAKGDPAVRSITLIQQTEAPNHLVLEETFANRAAYKRFIEAHYVRAFREALHPLLGSPWDERLGTELTD